jgi:ribosomal protein S6
MKIVKKNRSYETRVIFSPQSSEEELKDYFFDYARQLYRLSAEDISIISLGQRDFVYPKRLFKAGYFIEMRFVASPQILPMYENKLRLDQNVLSYLVLNTEKI